MIPGARELRQVTSGHVPLTVYAAKVTKTPASPDDLLEIALLNTQDQGSLASEQAPWPAKDTLPVRDDLCLVAIDDTGRPWVVGWDEPAWGTTDVGTATGATTGDVKSTAVPTTAGSEPAGWLLCDGRAVSRSTFVALFAAIGTAYGPGNGSTTFNLPDLRGRAPIGAGTGSGLTARALADTPGAETHTHTVKSDIGTRVSDDSTGIIAPDGSNPDSSSDGTSGGNFLNVGFPAAAVTTNRRKTTTSGGSAMQPSLALHYLVKT